MKQGLEAYFMHKCLATALNPSCPLRIPGP